MKRYIIKNGKFAGSRRIEGVTTRIEIGARGEKFNLIDQYVQRFKDETRYQMIKRIRLMHQDLIGYTIGDYKGAYGTPVDTGRAASSWILSFDKIGFVGEAPRSKSYPSKEQAIAREQAKLKNFTRLGDKIYFTNSVDYIYRLEYEGHSRQNSFFFAQAKQRVIKEYT